MFLDENGYFSGPQPIEPSRQERHPAERPLTLMTLGLALTMLVLPVSAVGVADIVNYLWP